MSLLPTMMLCSDCVVNIVEDFEHGRTVNDVNDCANTLYRLQCTNTSTGQAG
jgi:hypothetical protein